MFHPLFPLPFLVCFSVSIFTVLFIKPQYSLIKSIIISIVISTIATVTFIYLSPLLPYKFDAVLFPLFVGLLIGFVIIALKSIYNVFRITGRLVLKHEQWGKDVFKNIALYSIVAIIGILIAIPNIYVLFPHSHPWEKIDGTKSKMHTLALSLEEFSTKTKGYYPSHLNTRVLDVSKDIKFTSSDSNSVTGYINSDTVYANNIGTTGPSLLSNKERFKNVYGDSKPVLIFSTADPPVWDEKCMGAVYYVPIDVKGNIAKSYKIYGSGKNGFISTLETRHMRNGN